MRVYVAVSLSFHEQLAMQTEMLIYTYNEHMFTGPSVVGAPGSPHVYTNFPGLIEPLTFNSLYMHHNTAKFEILNHDIYYFH